MSVKEKASFLLWKYKEASWVYLILAVLYVAQSLLTTPSHTTMQKYNLRPDQLKALTLTIIIPYVIIWFIALLGYLRLRSYADAIGKDKDGQAFKAISLGILFFGLWLPMSAVLSNYFASIYDSHPASTAALTILNNYITLIVLVPAFLLIFAGSNKLVSLVKDVKSTPSLGLIIGYIIFSTLYVWLVLSDPSRRIPVHGVPVAAYYQPDWLIVITLVLPRLILWYLGAQAIQNIVYYLRKIKGSIYKLGLKNLVWGLGIVIFMTIGLRVLESLMVELERLSLGLLLLVVYLLLIVMSVGYVLIARGAAKLSKIEDL